MSKVTVEGRGGKVVVRNLGDDCNDPLSLLIWDGKYAVTKEGSSSELYTDREKAIERAVERATKK